MSKYIYILNIRTHKGKLYFPELLWSVMSNVCGISSVQLNKNKMIKSILSDLKLKYPLLQREKKLTVDYLMGN